jgi:hypothetical protein
MTVIIEDSKKQAPGNHNIVAVYMVGYRTLVTMGIVASIDEIMAYTLPNSLFGTHFDNKERVVTEMAGVEIPTTDARYNIQGADANVVINEPASLAAEPVITRMKSFRWSFLVAIGTNTNTPMQFMTILNDR